MDDISVHWYVSILVAEAGLEPAISAYETERITIFHIPRYIYNIPNNEPIKYKPITTNPTLKLLTIDSIKISFKSFILYISGMGMGSNHRHKFFTLCSTFWATTPIICSLVVDTHSRFTILCQQVNALYEFPVFYNHNILKNKVGLTFCLAFHLKNRLIPVGLWLPCLN